MKRSAILAVLALTLTACVTVPVKEKQTSSTNRKPSVNPPGELSREEVPMFVSIGFDDNSDAENLNWILNFTKGLTNNQGEGQAETFDGVPVSLSFFNNGKYSKEAGEAWKALYDNGHEIGNHSQNHYHGSRTNWSRSPATYDILMSQKQWEEEIRLTEIELFKDGIALSDIKGFRNPFLEYTDNSINAVYEGGYLYDCSIEEGYQIGKKPGNMYWPYTLDTGSPGSRVAAGWIDSREPIQKYPGLWELPVYVLVIPDDEAAAEYGLEPGLRLKFHKFKPYVKGSQWKITGFDYNILFTDSGEPMCTPEEFLTILKYNFDLRYAGNRAPFMLGAHIEHYSTPERRWIIEEFITYTMEKPEVRVVSFDKIVQWLENPAAL